MSTSVNGPFNVNISTTVIDGQIETLYVVFRDGEVAHETIAFNDTGADVLVDVDRHDIPIAIQFSPFKISEHARGDAVAALLREAADKRILSLYGCASKLVWSYRASRRNQCDVVRHAVESLGLPDIVLLVSPPA